MSKKEVTKYSDLTGKAYARNKFHSLVGKPKERKRAAFDIKEKQNYSQLCESIDFIEKNVPIVRQELYFGNPLPDSYENLGKLKDLPYLTKNIDAELNSCLIGIRKHKYEINLFLTYKDI